MNYKNKRIVEFVEELARFDLDKFISDIEESSKQYVFDGKVVSYPYCYGATKSQLEWLKIRAKSILED